MPMTTNRDINKLVLLVSCQKNKERQAVCFETWASRLPPNIKLRIVVGGSETKDDGLKLTVAAPDTRSELRNKMAKAYEWARDCGYKFDYVFKCDDDTFVDTDKLSLFDPVYSYVGHDNTSFAFDTRTSDITAPFALGGAGYFLSKNVLDPVIKFLPTLDIKTLGFHIAGEDVAVGYAMRLNKTPVVHCGLLNHGNFPCPLKTNHHITAHHIEPAHMRSLARLNAG